MEEVQAVSTIIEARMSPEVFVIIAGSLVSCASSIISALVPMPKEGSAWVWIRKIVDLLAVNIGNAKNAK